jgi:hypothetical protein
LGAALLLLVVCWFSTVSPGVSLFFTFFYYATTPRLATPTGVWCAGRVQGRRRVCVVSSDGMLVLVLLLR